MASSYSNHHSLLHSLPNFLERAHMGISTAINTHSLTPFFLHLAIWLLPSGSQEMVHPSVSTPVRLGQWVSSSPPSSPTTASLQCLTPLLSETPCTLGFQGTVLLGFLLLSLCFLLHAHSHLKTTGLSQHPLLGSIFSTLSLDSSSIFTNWVITFVPMPPTSTSQSQPFPSDFN